jgi:hypothetical protein
VKTGTRTRILAILLLLGATSLSGVTVPRTDKNAIGCQRSEVGGTPTPRGCDGGGDGCYVCVSVR